MMGKRFYALTWFLCLCSVVLPGLSILKEVQAAEVAYTVPFSPWITIRNLVWTGLTATDDVGRAFVGVGAWDTATVQVTGTFGVNGNLRIEASNDSGTPTWYTGKDITSAGVYVINAGYYQIRPRLTVSDGNTNLTVTVVLTKSTPDTKNLDDLLDVVIANPLNLHIPQYNSTTSKFENSLCSCPGGSGPGGLNTYIQFNDVGTFGGDAGFVYNKTTDTATLTNLGLTILTVTGTLSISNAAPQLFLLDSTPAAKNLLISLESDIAQIVAVGGGNNSLISFNLQSNTIGIFQPPDPTNYNFLIQKSTTAADPNNFARIGVIGTAATRANQLTLYVDSTVNGGSITNEEIGIQVFSGMDGGSGTVNRAVGIDFFMENMSATGTLTASEAIRIDWQRDFPTYIVSNTYGIRIKRDNGTRTRKYGFFYGAGDEQTEPVGSYAIYADIDPCYFGGGIKTRADLGATTFNYFPFQEDWRIYLRSGIQVDNEMQFGTTGIWKVGSVVGIGTLTPTAVLHLKAGTATANTAPLKFTAGTNLTTPEAGAMEFSGTDLFVTDSTPTRHGIVSHITDTSDAHGAVQSISGRLGINQASPNANAALDVAGQYFSERFNNGNSGVALTLNCANSNVQGTTLTANCTLSVSNGMDGGRYAFFLKQDATGSRTVTWWAGILWSGGNAPTLTTTANKTDIITFIFDGTNWFGSYSLNY